MFTKRVFYLVLVITIFAACAKKATTTSKGRAGKFDEDISVYRPKYEMKTSTPTETKTSSQTTEVTPKDFENKALEDKLTVVREKNKNIKYTQGYRVQVYSGSDQAAAEKAKESVYRTDPDFDPEVIYLQPLFKVKVGNYYDKLEAQAALMKLKQTFPQALLVPERVSIK